jgi:chromosome segregation ATPase
MTTERDEMQHNLDALRSELESASAESADLSGQLAQLRSQSDNSSSDVLSLTREMRELRGEMERLRAEREEWETEAERERERREAMEEEMRATERREREGIANWERAADDLDAERERAANLQDVLSEFQQGEWLTHVESLHSTDAVQQRTPSCDRPRPSSRASSSSPSRS